MILPVVFGMRVGMVDGQAEGREEKDVQDHSGKCVLL